MGILRSRPPWVAGYRRRPARQDAGRGDLFPREELVDSGRGGNKQRPGRRAQTCRVIRIAQELDRGARLCHGLPEPWRSHAEVSIRHCVGNRSMERRRTDTSYPLQWQPIPGAVLKVSRSQAWMINRVASLFLHAREYPEAQWIIHVLTQGQPLRGHVSPGTLRRVHNDG